MMDAIDVKIRVEDRGRMRMLAVSGELDVTGSAAFAGRIADMVRCWPGRVVIDLSGLRFADCGGARALAQVTGMSDGPRPNVVVRALRPQVSRVLRALGVEMDAHGQYHQRDPQRRASPAVTGSGTMELVRRTQMAVCAAHRSIIHSSRLAEGIAITEDDVADTFAGMAARRPQGRDRLSALSMAASSNAALMRRNARRADECLAKRRNDAEGDKDRSFLKQD